MVTISDLKVYKTTNFLGGDITGTQVISANPNNIFTNVPKNELDAGEDYYACIHLKNSGTERMDNLYWWLSSKTPPQDTELKWGFDPLSTVKPPYLYFNAGAASVNLGDQTALWSQAKTKFSFSFWIYTVACIYIR